MIYYLHYAKLTHEFIVLQPQAFQDIFLACMASEFQKISPDPVEVFTSDEKGGLEFPDFYYDNAVPLFSQALYEQMQKNGVDNVFLKKVRMIDQLQNLSKDYVLALPPRIDVLDENGTIDEKRIGNYQIFKTISDDEIYITESLKDCFQEQNVIGLEILPYAKL